MISKKAPDRTTIVLTGASVDGFSRTSHFAPQEKGNKGTRKWMFAREALRFPSSILSETERLALSSLEL
jgi:hypothetical protein